MADIAARLRETAHRAPEHEALVWHGQSITYGELNDRVDAAAGAFQHLGVTAGDRVAIVCGNVPAFVEAYFATHRCGAAAVPLNPDLTPDELRYVLADSGARVCVAAAAVADLLVPFVAELDDLDHLVAVSAGGLPPEVAEWRQLLAAGHGYREVARDLDDLAALVYTSGTTGRPRGAMLTRGDLYANQDQALAGRFEIGADEKVLLVLPLSHIYALNVGLGGTVRAGATVVLAERFDPAGSLQAIAAHAVTVVLGTPTMYLAWLNLPDAAPEQLRSVRLATSGAAPLPADVFHAFADRFGLVIEEGYGLTEAGPAVTSSTVAPAARARSVGWPLPGVELRLVDDHGLDVEPGDPGEVWVRSPSVFQGYWHDPDGTTAALAPDGWLRTGDIGTRDDDGYLYLVDRKRDLILVSGFNVYPEEVERVLHQHEAVDNCAVVGVPHPYTGETVKAFVVAVPGAELSEDEVAAFCRKHLARYKCPSVVAFVDGLPMTASGKVRRVELRPPRQLV